MSANTGKSESVKSKTRTAEVFFKQGTMLMPAVQATGLPIFGAKRNDGEDVDKLKMLALSFPVSPTARVAAGGTS